MLGVPAAVAELGLANVLAAAHRKIRVTAGVGHAEPALVHLDMPRWFHGTEDVPHLRTLAEAVRNRRRLRLGYQRGEQDAETLRVVHPFGLVNKAGTWYLVANGAEREVADSEISRSGTAGDGTAGEGRPGTGRPGGKSRLCSVRGGLPPPACCPRRSSGRRAST